MDQRFWISVGRVGLRSILGSELEMTDSTAGNSKRVVDAIQLVVREGGVEPIQQQLAAVGDVVLHLDELSDGIFGVHIGPFCCPIIHRVKRARRT